MLKENIAIIVDNEVHQYANKIGRRHLDVLKEVCEKHNLEPNKENELELALFLAENNLLTFLNAQGATIICIPENLNEYQINFLKSNKELLEKKQAENWFLEVVIASKNEVDYNNRQHYRNLSIEMQIAKYEGKIYNSQLEILYEEIDREKNKKAK